MLTMVLDKSTSTSNNGLKWSNIGIVTKGEMGEEGEREREGGRHDATVRGRREGGREQKEREGGG